MARWVLAGLLLLAGCAGAESPSSAARCEAAAPVVVPLGEYRGRPIVQVMVDGQTARLAIDTGANRSSLTPEAIGRLGLRRDRNRRSMVSGTGGLVVNDGVIVEALEFGGRRLGRPQLAVHGLPGMERAEPPIDGLLGADLLMPYDVELDLAARRMLLHQVVAGCPGAEPAWADRTPLPLPIERRGRMFLLEVRLNGQPVRALLDSGADGTVMTEAAARRIGVTTAMMEAAPQGEARGADGNARVIRRLRFERVEVGPQRLAMAAVRVSPMSLQPGTEMLLGLDYIRTRRLFLSYSSGRVWVAEPPG
ncbi:retroviral-like aspartic protease family protein [Belnapia sp. F-4-1]|uniref:retroviral-like aspartic protease family protein n=1 Tax=Belnapia sp. F-4-1 TaxID=1545443 RepID=UPI0005BD0F45|nr:retroviral-like aspartic protease family protein [Belnapia sp. F-4-1]